ncbi:MAG: hypothetical protein ABGY41_11875 [Candidatus Poribacteria bacterium]
MYESHLELAHSIMISDGEIGEAEKHIRLGLVAMRRLEAATGYVARASECFELIGDEYGRRGSYRQATEFWLRSVECGASAFLHRRLLMKLEGRFIAEGRQDEFPALCRELWPKIESAPGSVLRRPYLTLTAPSHLLISHDSAFALPTGESDAWRWIDPTGKAQRDSYTKTRVALRAPRKDAVRVEPPECLRLLQPIAGTFAAETVLDVSEPAAGGLLLWASESEYAFIGKWFRANPDIRTVTCTGGEPGTVARGQFPTDDRLHLRLEYDGQTVRTLCSKDGDSWLLSAEEPFSPSGPLQLGIYADGDYDVEWVATTFTDFRVYRPTSGHND